MTLVRISGIPGPHGTPKVIAGKQIPQHAPSPFVGYQRIGATTNPWMNLAAWQAIGPGKLTAKQQQDNNTILTAWKNRVAADESPVSQGFDSWTYLLYQLMNAYGFPIINPSMSISQQGSSLDPTIWRAYWLYTQQPQVYALTDQDYQQILSEIGTGLSSNLKTPLKAWAILPDIVIAVATGNLTPLAATAASLMAGTPAQQTQAVQNVESNVTAAQTLAPAVTTTGNAVLDFIEANPLPSIMIGVGAAIVIYEIVKPKKHSK